MLITDLYELKSILEIDPSDSTEDKRLNFYVEYASSVIEDFLGRQGRLFYGVRTEYYSPTNTPNLVLKSRPVYLTPTPIIYEDSAAGFVSGSFGNESQLTFGTDFELVIDQADGVTSRSGVIRRIDGIWTRRGARLAGLLSPFSLRNAGGIKVVYAGGYKYENMPAALRLACNTVVAHIRYLFPMGMELSSESYEERAIGLVPHRQFFLSLVKPLLHTYHNWYF